MKMVAEEALAKFLLVDEICGWAVARRTQWRNGQPKAESTKDPSLLFITLHKTNA